jgi:hypothetical protein
MTRAVLTSPDRRAHGEPLYDIDPQTGASIEVFYADDVLARSLGASPGWFCWTCQPGRLPDSEPIGPFPTSYSAYRDAMGGGKRLFGKEPLSGQ